MYVYWFKIIFKGKVFRFFESVMVSYHYSVRMVVANMLLLQGLWQIVQLLISKVLSQCMVCIYIILCLMLTHNWPLQCQGQCHFKVKNQKYTKMKISRLFFIHSVIFIHKIITYLLILNIVFNNYTRLSGQFSITLRHTKNMLHSGSADIGVSTRLLCSVNSCKLKFFKSKSTLNN